jgi:bacteriocin-like protein
MRTLNIEELNQVEGGGIVARWAFKMGDALANMYAVYEAAGLFNFDFSSYGSADAGGYNPMGDYANNMCAR